MSFNDDVSKQVSGAFPGFDTNSPDFIALEQLNYLSFFLITAMNSLTFAEKFNQDSSITKDEQVYISHSLFKDALMSYAKCFGAAQAKRIKIDFNAVISKLEEPDKLKYRSIHDEMILIRNSYIAHNLDNDFERSTIVSKLESNVLKIKPVYTIKTPVNDFKKYMSQCGLVQNYLIKKIHTTLAKIQKTSGVTIDFGG